VLGAKGRVNVECAASDALQPFGLGLPLHDIDVTCCLVHSMAVRNDFGRLDLKAADSFARADAIAWLCSFGDDAHNRHWLRTGRVDFLS
jgi:hypothetical protein